MGNRIYDNEFEEFLKEQSSQHRMYPSDHVWRNINKEIHGYSKWPALTVIAIFIIASLVVGTILTNPHGQLIKDQLAKQPVVADEPRMLATTELQADNIKKPVLVNNLSIEKITQQTIDIAKETVQKNNNTAVLDISTAQAQTAVSNSISLLAMNFENNVSNDNKVAVKENAIATPAPKQDYITSALASYNIMKEMQKSKNEFSNIHFKNNYQFFTGAKSSTVEELYVSRFNFESQPLPRDNTIGSRISRIGNKSTRYDFQVYITPSVSYRRLVDNAEGQLSKSYISALPYEANYIVDVNQVVNHRASTGLEVGFNLGYNLNKKLVVRSGFQFNMQQYKIDAFVHSFEPATIALTQGNQNVLFNTVSTFRNAQGSEPIELTNRYYQVSMPIGIDWRPINGKFSWGIALAVQPTYTFDKEPFIITSNYKNYADGSQLMRNWNINTNFETYVGYTTGKYRWQLGPQFRYQLMPTMANNYPIKEYLLDYGIKLGLVRALR